MRFGNLFGLSRCSNAPRVQHAAFICILNNLRLLLSSNKLFQGHHRAVVEHPLLIDYYSSYKTLKMESSFIHRNTKVQLLSCYGVPSHLRSDSNHTKSIKGNQKTVKKNQKQEKLYTQTCSSRNKNKNVSSHLTPQKNQTKIKNTSAKMIEKCKSESHGKKNQIKSQKAKTSVMFNSLNFGDSQMSLLDKDGFLKNESKQLSVNNFQNNGSSCRLNEVFQRTATALYFYEKKCESLEQQNLKIKFKLGRALIELQKYEKTGDNKVPITKKRSSLMKSKQPF